MYFLVSYNIKANLAIKRKSESPKMLIKSAEQARNKLRKKITKIIDEIGTEEDSNLSYWGVGRLLNMLGVYKETYNEIENNEDLNRTLSEREMKENEFQENFWKLFCETNTENVNPKLIIEILVILFDSHIIPIKALSKTIDSIFSLL